MQKEQYLTLRDVAESILYTATMLLMDDVHFFFLQNLNSNTKISDIRGRKLPAMKVFTSAIEYLKNHLLDHLKERFIDHFKTDDIYWVLTVPAIWNDKGKLFMRSAAQKVSNLSQK